MIILEGPDNSGKSTLAKKLARLLCCNVVHSEQPEKGGKPEFYLEHSRNQLKDEPRIQDRVFAISEVAYGTLLRGGCRTQHLTQTMLKDLADSDHLIIYCRPPIKNIIEPNGRSQMAGVRENHLRITNFYDNFLKNWKVYAKVQIVEYDWTKGGAFDELAEIVTKYWSRYE